MDICISKKDVVWGYFATFFSIGAGFLTLPLILNKLSAEEVGMNYLMLSVGGFVSLLECSFAGLIGRNITYVFSGAQILTKEGLIKSEKRSDINYHLISVLIKTAQFIYRRISLLVLFTLLFLGTFYMYYVTKGFSNVKHSLLIWLTYSISVYFNIYYMYYESLLTGSAQVMEQKKAMIYSKLVYIILCYIMLLFNFGLFSVVASNMIAPFVSRFYSYHKFYTEELRKEIKKQIVYKKEVVESFKILWYSASKLVVNSIGSYFCTNAGMFIAGLFLSLKDVASYGLMLQIFSVIASVSAALVSTYQPLFCKLQVQNNKVELTKKFSFSMIVMLIVILFGGLFVLFFGNICLHLIKSNSEFPSFGIMLIFLLNQLLSSNHAYCATFIATSNKIPFVKASVIAGVAIVLLSLVFLYFTSMGILSLILSQLIVHSVYNHWKWPKWVLKDLDISFWNFFFIGFSEMKLVFIKQFKKAKVNEISF